MSPRSLAPRAVLFDLDGTLLDTAPDFHLALNALLAEEQRAPLAPEVIRPHVSHGSPAMLRLAFGIEADHPTFDARRARFLAHYEAVLARATVPFPGVIELLDELERRGLRWGIVTNKPGWLTAPLLAAVGLAARTGCAISGDTTARAKPHPEPLLAGAAALDLAPSRCLYVGDAARDVEAARAAGMPVLVALYGYLAVDDRPQDWGGDGAIARALDLLAWL